MNRIWEEKTFSEIIGKDAFFSDGETIESKIRIQMEKSALFSYKYFSGEFRQKSLSTNL